MAHRIGERYHDDPMPRLSLKITAPLVMSVPVLVAVLVLAYLAISQARATASDLAAQNLEQIHERIRVRVDDLLTIPRRIGRVNRHMIRSGQLDPRRLRAWLPTLHEESVAFGMLSTICWGSPDGRAVWIARYPGMTTYEFAVKDHKTAEIEIFNDASVFVATPIHGPDTRSAFTSASRRSSSSSRRRRSADSRHGCRSSPAAARKASR